MIRNIFFACLLAIAAPAMAEVKSAPAQIWCETGANCFKGYEAHFGTPVARYGHGVLGDTPEWASLHLKGPKRSFDIRLNVNVFEDVAPRLADMDGDRIPEVIAVESHPQKGARLNIYFAKGKRVSTPYIGTRFRWLAPFAAGDFNGDGNMNVAYVDRPHLAKVLRIFSYEAGKLDQIATLDGFSTHRIGEAFITGGMRRCGAMSVAELVLADGRWQNVMGVAYTRGKFEARAIAPFKGPKSVENALSC